MRINMNENDNYNVMSEHNNKLYLTMCLTFAHGNNNYYQNAMKKIFKTHEKCVFNEAPVKTYERCLIKSNTDYNDRLYPSVACIVGMFVLFIFCIFFTTSKTFSKIHYYTHFHLSDKATSAQCPITSVVCIFTYKTRW